MTRTWCDIRGLEGRYQVSSDGYVRSLPDIDARGRFMLGRILRASLSDKGYPRVVLDGQTHRVHRLVARAFLPNLAGLPQVNHKNGVKTDNRAANLEWCDNAANQEHRHRVLGQPGGTTGKRGIACKNSKQVRGAPVGGGHPIVFGSAAEAARVLGIESSGISMAARGLIHQYKKHHWEYITREEFNVATA